MALPDYELSSFPLPDLFVGARALPRTNTLDFESGGSDVGNTSPSLFYQYWKCRVENDTILLNAEEVDDIELYSGINITEISLSFDQNMNPTVAFVEDGIPKLYWFNTQLNDTDIKEFDPDIKTPRVSLDEKRNEKSNVSDIIFAYLRNGNLYHRLQRDRYDVEYLLKENVNATGIEKIGMGRHYRFQFLLRR